MQNLPQEFIIETLLELGGKRWRKDNYDRVYLKRGLIRRLLGLKYIYGPNGIVCGYSLDGKCLTESQGKELIDVSFYYDISTGKYYSSSMYATRLFKSLQNELESIYQDKDPQEVLSASNTVNPQDYKGIRTLNPTGADIERPLASKMLDKIYKIIKKYSSNGVLEVVDCENPDKFVAVDFWVDDKSLPPISVDLVIGNVARVYGMDATDHPKIKLLSDYINKDFNPPII